MNWVEKEKPVTGEIDTAVTIGSIPTNISLDFAEITKLLLVTVIENWYVWLSKNAVGFRVIESWFKGVDTRACSSEDVKAIELTVPLQTGLYIKFAIWELMRFESTINVAERITLSIELNTLGRADSVNVGTVLPLVLITTSFTDAVEIRDPFEYVNPNWYSPMFNDPAGIVCFALGNNVYAHAVLFVNMQVQLNTDVSGVCSMS